MADMKSKEQSFYLNLSEVPPTEGFKDLLKNYSNVSEAETSHHIETVRDEAWDHWPYPSIGLFTFTHLGLAGDDLPKDDAKVTQTIQTAYQSILQKLKTGGKLLDVGCMFSQDTRKLVHDGALPSSVYGTDLRGEYFTHGYKLFRDVHIIPPEHFIAADILDEDDIGLKKFQGQLDVINTVHLIHVFSLEDQRKLIQRFIVMLKQEKGVMVTGRLAGNVNSGYHELTTAKSTTKSGDGKMWQHSAESFKKLWREEAEATDTKWKVDCWLWRWGIHTGKKNDPNWHRKETDGILTFIATRL